MFISLLISLLALISIVSSQQIKFEYTLAPKEKQCLFEYFPEKTMVIYSVKTRSLNSKIELKDSKGAIMYVRRANNLNEGFTTTSSDYLELCCENLGKDPATFDYELKYGVGANDYSSIVKSKDLQPIEAEIKNIISKKSIIDHYKRFGENNDNIFESTLDSMSQRIIFYSVYLILFMIFIGFVEIVYLKKFMQKRKII